MGSENNVKKASIKYIIGHTPRMKKPFLRQSIERYLLSRYFKLIGYGLSTSTDFTFCWEISDLYRLRLYRELERAVMLNKLNGGFRRQSNLPYPRSLSGNTVSSWLSRCQVLESFVCA